MKNTLVALLLVGFGFGCETTPTSFTSSSGLMDSIGAPQSLVFRGETYGVGHSAVDGSKYLVEYFRAGETPNSWHKMMALRLDSEAKGSLQAVGAMEKLIQSQPGLTGRAFKSTDGHGVEFIVTTRGRQELDVFRYIDRTNGLVSLQYAEIIPREDLRRMAEMQVQQYFITIRSNAVWGMEAIQVPIIESK